MAKDPQTPLDEELKRQEEEAEPQAEPQPVEGELEEVAEAADPAEQAAA